MSLDEWESVCDGCAKCCLTQLQDELTEQLVFTDVACDLLNGDTCRCHDYKNRSARVPECVTMTIENVEECAKFMPQSCSYRLLLEGKPLPNWHHLVSGKLALVHRAGHSVYGRVRFERNIKNDELENYVVDWC